MTYSSSFRLTILAFSMLGSAFSQPAASYISRTVAGVFPIGDNGPATSALLESPQAVAADASGNLFIADSGNGAIRKVARNGVITSLVGYSGAVFDLKLDTAGNLFIAAGNYAYKLTPAGVLTAIAGNGSYTAATGDGGPATSAGFNGIYALALDSTGNVYICDSNNHKIRKVGTDGIVTTIAGANSKGYFGDNVPAASAIFNFPRNIAIDSANNIYINDYSNNKIRKINASDGKINTIAGNGVCCDSPDGGLGTAAYLVTGPVTTDPSGNVYVYDYLTSRIRKVSSSGIITSFAGDGKEGFAGDGGGASSARFSHVNGMGTDAANNVYIADGNNERIRMVSNGVITTIAGKAHFAGDGGAATAALLHRPAGVVTAPDGTIYFTDTVNHRVRKIGTDGKVSTIAGTGDPGFSGDGNLGTAAQLSYPDAIARDSAGNLYVVDQGQLRVRKITPSGIISTVAGNGIAFYSNNARGALGSPFAYITGIAVDSSGNMYLSEQLNSEVKKIVPTGGMTTYAGTSGFGFSGDGGAATSAVLGYPGALAVDGSSLYIADSFNRIRKVDGLTGNISTVAGNGSCCATGDGGSATSAKIDVYGMAPDGNGGLWFSDDAGVRFIAKDGTISRVSGGLAGFAGDDAPAGGATQYNAPTGVAAISTNELIIADTNNSRIRRLQANDPTKMEIVSGNNQKATTGTTTDALIVKLTGKTGLPAGGVRVTFTVTAGSADLTAKTSLTDTSGQAGIAATPTKAGNLTVTATFGTFTATFNLTVTDPIKPPPATDVPVISDGGIGQNGFSVPAVQSVSTGAITTIYGSNFMAAGTPPAINTVADGQLSMKFAGVCVTFGTVRAPIFAVATTQITVEIPAVTPGPVAVQVLRNCDDPAQQKSNVLTVSAQTTSPEFLYLQINADGKNPVAAVGTDNLYIAPPSLIPGARAAAPGDILVIYALGLGATDPAQTVGVPAGGIGSAAPPVITIGGVQVGGADLFYAGVSPGYIGLYQINLRVPAGVPSGNQPITIKIGGNTSPAGGYLTVQ
ncbi:MAG TPA: IPT/TIG domain-containing protein [Candidatus Solibacter sp.]|nr:IPT/TIG domain-containing protein [Candidatus Solibacter sp.]